MNKSIALTLGVVALSISMTAPLVAQSGRSDRQLLIRLKSGKTVIYSLDEIESIQFSDASGTTPASGSSVRDRDTRQANPPSSSSSDQPIAPVTAKWFRVAIRSNYGHPNYTQLMDIRFYQAGSVKTNP